MRNSVYANHFDVDSTRSRTLFASHSRSETEPEAFGPQTLNRYLRVPSQREMDAPRIVLPGAIRVKRLYE